MEVNEKIRSILYVAFQFIVDTYIDTNTRIKQIDVATNEITLILRDKTSYKVVPAFELSESTLHSQYADQLQWKIALPIDAISNLAWFKSLDQKSRKSKELEAPSRAILTMRLADGSQEEVILPYTINCQKLVAALNSEPQIITDEDYDEITPTLAAGWQLVTIPNPDRLGLRDTLLLLPQSHQIAVDAYRRLYGTTPVVV